MDGFGPGGVAAASRPPGATQRPPQRAGPGPTKCVGATSPAPPAGTGAKAARRITGEAAQPRGTRGRGEQRISGLTGQVRGSPRTAGSPVRRRRESPALAVRARQIGWLARTGSGGDPSRPAMVGPPPGDDPPPILEGDEGCPDPGRPRSGQVLDPEHAASEQDGRVVHRGPAGRRRSRGRVVDDLPGRLHDLAAVAGYADRRRVTAEAPVGREQRRSSVHQIFRGVPGRGAIRSPSSAVRRPADRLQTASRSVHEHRETRTRRGRRHH